ncbi:regulator of chromosome condensation 1/beta-lactamase-inhibitor protein II [Xylariomycetidae sp. FL2044]|nr:regulator of chromosome condensation 1/beta-lactamase-inhibitor protein II [Xylariomycetidae sp. FL2044]
MDGLFAHGSNGSGQLGLGHKEDVSVPKPVRFAGLLQAPARITQVAAGGNHTIVRTEDGRAYWSGDATTGACGIVDDSTSSTEFREIRLFPPKKSGESTTNTEDTPRVANVACTWDSSILVVEDERGEATRVYVCGMMTTTTGQNPSPTSSISHREPELLRDFPPRGTRVRDIAAGFRHVVTVLDNGEVWGWGNGRKGQLGPPPPSPPLPLPPGDTDTGTDDARGLVRRPRKIEDVGFAASRAVCCQYATCLIGEPGDGRIRVLGADKWGLKTDAPVEVPNWKAIGASWGGIYILKRDGAVIAWGRNDRGQLPPLGLPPLVGIAAGSEHVVALMEQGNVLAWGWGEHGNCGPETDGDGDVKGRWSVIVSQKHMSGDSEITAIGAGCATTWIHITANGLSL